MYRRADVPERREGAPLEARVATLEKTVDRLDGDMYNHGKDGLKTQFVTFVAGFEAREKERAIQLKKHNNQWATIVALLGLLFGGIEAYHEITEPTQIQTTVSRSFHDHDVQQEKSVRAK